ncbi:thermonuclease family protein [Candidatus Nomurabacteria bacterium]|nr:thermonuclease family protein [Candidatus Nomurabacteria bacterium]
MDKRNKKKLIRILSSIFIALILILLQQNGMIPGQEKLETTVENSTPGLYSVTKFDDGDTIGVDMEGKTETIRFIGVDTPETHDPRKSVQCFGKDAAAFTKAAIGSQKVRLEADPESDNRDRYSRLLRFVYLPNGELVNYELVKEGYGFAITGFPHTKMETFVNAETEAKNNGRGLWGTCQIDNSLGHPQTNPV